MIEEFTVKYFNFIEKWKISLSKINNYVYLYILLWWVQVFILVCKIEEINGAINLCMVGLLSIGVIHFSISVVEIINDYIFNKVVKGIFGTIMLIITYKLII